MPDSKRHVRQRAILDAACVIADTEGLDAVTVRATAQRAGVGIGTLRHYFPTQRDLFDAIVERRVDAVIDDSVVLDSSAALDTRISGIVHQFLPTELDDVGALGLWFASYSTALGPTPSVASQQLLTAAARRSHQHMRRWLQHFADDGLVAHDAIEDAAGTAIALTVGLALEALTPGSPMTIERGRTLLTQHFTDLMTKAMQ
ncbi:MAG: TetR/AcrR family transcriptional regulator [Rhodococcus sp. (in: high G+C Gram-positive bacteria)]|uniref:TetR/AcrR family transcriptional regulator n=1 Tax=Rhodococcus sp. TaxID=1831 RepID=UPI002AD64F07|nr:TetR/AcrR family transcriptional regulator [Rhodococcus sp. (in: high G+C Gram-positive bacteria)]